MTAEAALEDFLHFLSRWLARVGAGAGIVESILHHGIQATVKQCKTDIGQIQPMSRGELNWQITIPQNSSLSFAGIVPTLIEWNTDQHPSGRLHESSCRLVSLDGYHDQPELIQNALVSLGLEKEIVMRTACNVSGEPLKAQIATPSGIVELV